MRITGATTPKRTGHSSIATFDPEGDNIGDFVGTILADPGSYATR
jgi:hypothetical protein